MTKGFLIFIVPGILVLIVVGVILFGQGSSFFGGSRKIEVSNLKIDYGRTLYSDFQSTIYFRVKNLYGSQLTNVGLMVNGVNYGLSSLQVPPGQTVDWSGPLPNTAINSSSRYEIEMTFTFADGKYQTNSESYTTPEYKGQIQVTTVSLTRASTYAYNFHVEIKNTGNLPIMEAKYVFFGGFEEIFSPLFAAPGETLSGGKGLSNLSGSIVAGSAYPVTIRVRYIDGSTSVMQTSVIASK
jgi:hypothetical protein